MCSIASIFKLNGDQHWRRTEDVTNHPYLSNSSMSLPCKTCPQFFKHVTKNFDRVFPFCLGTAEARHTRLPVNFRWKGPKPEFQMSFFSATFIAKRSKGVTVALAISPRPCQLTLLWHLCLVTESRLNRSESPFKLNWWENMGKWFAHLENPYRVERERITKLLKNAHNMSSTE